MADDFEMSVRKFLKQVGVTAQQELQRAAGSIGPDGPRTRTARAVITLDGSDLHHVVEAEIVLPDSNG
ncbi:hypothetical protein GCM10017083_14110 [Thalassobaculum fulvum]|uniref:Uncharacterized protein n=1 Tax=Thalassobaculum fulvum TaxID=1633335 RepID=A0A919CNJ3_9PROT|nr:DUF6494 family protein [Thalassobaculum fulvum]GHD45731.1 hypothetical protein GCM10017083_14110 [Thalassobaculum fulvum]